MRNDDEDEDEEDVLGMVTMTWRYLGNGEALPVNSTGGSFVHQRRMRQSISGSVNTHDRAHSSSPLSRCARDATCSNVMRTGGPDASSRWIFSTS